MPELPEVEVTRLGIAERLRGKTIVGVRLGKPLRWPLGIKATALKGRRIEAVTRRGKYLVMQLDEGALIVHLGMSGSLRWRGLEVELEPHDHFIWDLPLESLRLNDPRRFGAVVHSAQPEQHPLLAQLGVEPLAPEFQADYLIERLRGKTQAIKQALLDQRVVVGVGNIYASEALFSARVHPDKPAGALRRVDITRLVLAVRQVLQQAITQGGSSLRDYVQPDGELGCFQTLCLVYDRKGEPCRVCNSHIARIQQGQRSTYFCPRCQRR